MLTLMIGILLAATMCVTVVGATNTVEIGNTMDEVTAILGKPASVMKAGTNSMWRYTRGKVEFVNGKVVSRDLIGEEELIRGQAEKAEKAEKEAEEQKRRPTFVDVGRWYDGTVGKPRWRFAVGRIGSFVWNGGRGDELFRLEINEIIDSSNMTVNVWQDYELLISGLPTTGLVDGQKIVTTMRFAATGTAKVRGRTVFVLRPINPEEGAVHVVK